MNLAKTLFVATKSRYELMLEKCSGRDAARANCQSDLVWADWEEGHHNQKANLRKVSQQIDSELIVDRSQLTEETIRKHNFFVLLGGDNHFTYCAHEILEYQRRNLTDLKQVIGCVLDSRKSLGVLLDYNVDSLLGSRRKLEEDKYRVEHWTTLEATISGERTSCQPYPALCEYVFGENCFFLMSRNKALIDGKEIVPEKGSGLLVVTGSGSGRGSWYDNIYGCYFDKEDAFGRSEDMAKIVTLVNRDKVIATLRKGQVLEVHSSNDDNGIGSTDSHKERVFNFAMGYKAEVRISDYKLHVIRPKLN
ncbi:MAG: hypothetical protein V2A62_03860 [Candidatus Woesearchaeota archaeon]